MTDDRSKTPPRNTDVPSETAQKGLPETGDGASARHYLRDADPKLASESRKTEKAEKPTPED